jgi:hypothetical protein
VWCEVQSTSYTSLFDQQVYLARLLVQIDRLFPICFLSLCLCGTVPFTVPCRPGWI